MADGDDAVALNRIESWIQEIVRAERDSLSDAGDEPLDLGELEGTLRLPPPPELPPSAKSAA